MLFNDIIGIVFSTQPQQIGAKDDFLSQELSDATRDYVHFNLIRKYS